MSVENKVEKNDKVKVEYEGKLSDGQIFDSSNRNGEQHPLEFVAGMGQVIPGFDNAIVGMRVKEEKEFTIPRKEAYGERREELKQKVPRDKLPKLPEGQELKAGMMLMVGQPGSGQQMPVKITEVSENEITIDLNHPLAGEDLTFKIKVVGIEKGSAEKTEEKDDTKKKRI